MAVKAKNRKYWRERFEILKNAAHQEADRCISDLEKIFWEAERTVRADIERWYGRFADNNQISLVQAKKWLTSGQLEEFKWTVDQYIKAGEQASLSPEWIKKLENASARFHISRLESIQLQIQQQIELLYGNQLDSMDNLLKDVVSNGYTKTAFELQKGIGVGWDITALNQMKLETLLSKPWTTDKRTFRDRCWEHQANLAGGIQNDLTQGLLRGSSSQKITDAVSKRFGVSRYKAGRLVHTETTYFNAISSLESYRELGVDKAEIIETLDESTCELCREMDGMVIPLSQFEPGVTVPPFHANCRGTTAPAIDEDIIGERAARDAEGEVYYVPSNMKYPEWKKVFVDGGAKDGLTAAPAIERYADIASQWYQNATPNSHAVKELYTYTVNGASYTVDGHNVVLDYSDHEKEIADLLEREFGGELFMVPRVNNPQGISTPDYLFRGKGYDLKTIGAGAGENAIFNRLKKAKRQAHNFIIDVTNVTFDDKTIEEQIVKIFWSDNTKFVDEIIVIRGNKILKVAKRT